MIGMGASGMAAAILADSLGGRVFVSDCNRRERLTDQIGRLKVAGIPFEVQGHTERLLESDYIIVSPGVPSEIDIIRKAEARGIPVFSEIEFASWVWTGKVAGITGSNGKTTTTTLISEILSASGMDARACGNIGLPFAEVALQPREEAVAVVEVSTFQLERIADFRPDVAVILNLTADHLDRHGTFDIYKALKYRITENQQGDDTLVLNADDSTIAGDQIVSRAKRRYFSVQDNPQWDTFVREGRLYGRREDTEVMIIAAGEVRIPGPHNLQNAAAAACVAMEFGVEIDFIRKVLRSFAGVEHRLEKVARIGGVDFINDSKATNVDSVCYALRSVDTPVYLIAGGRDKGSAYDPIIRYGQSRIQGMVLIGEAKEKMIAALGSHFSSWLADSLEEAVVKCFEMARPGDTVLLSPGCASFDMFENFEHRGRVFKAAVANLRNASKRDERVSD